MKQAPISLPNLAQICQLLAEIAPLKLAEDWDNVGLLIGDRQASIGKVMTCLTITPDVVGEAEREGVGLIVAHHPFPFKPVAKVTADTASGEMLWRLCRAGIAVYSAHTAFDSAAGGINDQWTKALQLADCKPMLPLADNAKLGAGRVGRLADQAPAAAILKLAASFSGSTRPRLVGPPDRGISRIGVACGSGGSFVSAALRCGCDFLLTGEATFHACLEAENAGLSLGLVGHYASERFAMDALAQRLQSAIGELPGAAKSANDRDMACKVWASHDERDVIG
ncbi:dinuclear metal center protein, YbgI/SA1388 family [Neorhodopirellula lusitana]|uniref:Dinuclear metal center protein, YbgI/SA1388 family n=1 Tax=Neorhodopirellula lusitana TaxID=445327 RepID=A0ABY1PZ92_9BACT|nr:Nif3-like dinuclear metal center hexameric protein [Neorhodopirellula lusitana]SMP53861.1 dinuclear metal center protein, YbgI/SA1388 family [Neorhodopirellula lusitana]